MGRPKKIRNKTAGIKIRRAISFWGKSISKNNISDNHVCNWPRWIECGLPKSPTTVYDDIDRGVPIDRICSYAKCFNVDVEVFLDDAVQPESVDFAGLISQAKSELQNPSVSVLQKGSDGAFVVSYSHHNDETYINSLYDILSGCYVTSYLFMNSEPSICTAACRIAEKGDGFVLGKAVYPYQGVEIDLAMYFYRWHNNLHLRYFSNDCFELGHCIGVDPVRHQSVFLRSPFYFHMLGITDDGSSANLPVHIRGLFEKVGPDTDEAWDECLERQKGCGVIDEGRAEYPAVMEKLMAQDL